MSGRIVAVLAVASSASCALGVDSEENDGTVGTTRSAVVQEEAGINEFMFRQYRKLPGVALASYATPSVGNCGAAMIGPHTMIGASHCGPATSATFRTYRNGNAADPNAPIASSYVCRYLVHTFVDSDLNVYWCDSGSDGVPPGERYGYLDMGTVRPSVNQVVYSSWTHHLHSDQVPWGALLYSPGYVTHNDMTQGQMWELPTNAGNVGIRTNVWGEPGSSGSVQLDAFTHKIVIGPTTGVNTETGDRWRTATSMYDYLYWGRAEPGWPTPAVNETYVASQGLNPQAYYGWIDDELDFLIDIQTDLELQRGERQRDWYNLGFESPRRNKLWTLTQFAAFSGKLAWVGRSDGGNGVVLSHSRLNLVDQGRYVLTGMVSRLSGTGEFSIGLNSSAGGFSGSTLTVHTNTTPFTIPVTATGENSELVVRLNGNGEFHITSLALIRTGATTTMNFDTDDQRKLWNDAGGQLGPPGPAFIVPDGRTTPGLPNWALYVPPWTGRLYSGRLNSVPATNRRYTVCFQHILDVNGTVSRGRARLSGSGPARTLAFDVGWTWQTTCAADMFGPMTIQFGVESGSAYRVDDVTITET